MAKGKDDPCWKGYEAYGTKQKSGEAGKAKDKAKAYKESKS